jgi:hypothetical protein
MTDNTPGPQPGDPGPSGEVVVPSDFPRDPFPAALSGSQPKFSARFIDGQYVVGLTQEERKQRYLACADLVDQLTAYVKRKHSQRPDLTLSAILDNVASRIPYQGWDLGHSEIDWMVKHLRARFPQGSNGQ